MKTQHVQVFSLSFCTVRMCAADLRPTQLDHRCVTTSTAQITRQMKICWSRPIFIHLNLWNCMQSLGIICRSTRASLILSDTTEELTFEFERGIVRFVYSFAFEERKSESTGFDRENTRLSKGSWPLLQALPEARLGLVQGTSSFSMEAWRKLLL